MIDCGNASFANTYTFVHAFALIIILLHTLLILKHKASQLLAFWKCLND